MTATSTKDKALIEASNLSQQVGFKNFSIQQVADKLGIKQPSIYRHFTSKDELGEAMIGLYRESFRTMKETIEDLDPRAQIDAYFSLAAKFCLADKVCGFVALLGDYNALPKSMQRLVDKMLEDQKEWLSSVIKRGQKEHLFRKDRKADEIAEIVISGYVGTQMLGKVTANLATIEYMKETILEFLKIKNSGAKE
ncbi:MAG TPA: TetR/AcrR family transcriptional regulator [Bdellovibrio sp.]|uniref:TetR/AcrR family transcriptional regulator n=1 Tax=Bdellovibrio sp. TaxID=28201 RepID=UPI002EEC6222